MRSVRPWVLSSTQPETRPTERFPPAELGGQQSHRIGAGAEEGGVAQGDDAGVAQHQIEREREQHQDQDLGAQRRVVWEDEVRGQGDEPGQELHRFEAMARGHKTFERRLSPPALELIGDPST